MNLNDTIQAKQMLKVSTGKNPKQLNVCASDARSLLNEMLAHRALPEDVEQDGISAYQTGGEAILNFLKDTEFHGMKIKIYSVVE